MTAEMDRLIAASSLGTPEAVALREQTSDETARRIVERAKFFAWLAGANAAAEQYVALTVDRAASLAAMKRRACELYAAALLVADSALLPMPARHVSETWHPDGCVDVEVDGFLVGGTVPVPYVEDEWELWWLCRDGECDGNFTAGVGEAADLLRAYVAREAW